MPASNRNGLEGTNLYRSGDRIQAMVVSTAGGLVLSRKLVRGAATERQLEDAFRAGLPVEGKVEKAGKGGYEVRIARERHVLVCGAPALRPRRPRPRMCRPTCPRRCPRRSRPCRSVP